MYREMNFFQINIFTCVSIKWNLQFPLLYISASVRAVYIPESSRNKITALIAYNMITICLYRVYRSHDCPWENYSHIRLVIFCLQKYISSWSNTQATDTLPTCLTWYFSISASCKAMTPTPTPQWLIIIRQNIFTIELGHHTVNPIKYISLTVSYKPFKNRIYFTIPPPLPMSYYQYTYIV